jgi:hypothetical protein
VNNLTYICSQQTKKNNYGSWNWEVLISALEYIGTDGGDSKDKKGCGCMIVIISVNYRWLALLWYDLYQSEPLKGL